MASATNAFSGNFRLWDSGVYSGQLDGRFYGPAAQEIGAAFSGTTGDGRAVVGALIGRGAPVTAVNTSINWPSAPSVSEFFTNDAGMMSATLTGTSGTNQTTGAFSGRSQSAASIVVHFDASAGAYTLISSNQSGLAAQGSQLGNATFFVPTLPFGSDNLMFLPHLQLRRWSSAQFLPGSTAYNRSYVTLGVETPDALLPRTGTAGYGISVVGTAADADYPNLIDFDGRGTLTTNFATGAISGEAMLTYVEDYTPSLRSAARSTGFLNLSATLSSGTNAFSGGVTLSGIGSYTGTVRGRFYGPSALEVGAAFSATDGAGGVLSGGLIGERSASADPVETIASLGAKTTFSSKAYYHRTERILSSPNGPYAAYDPVTQTYDFYPGVYTPGSASTYRVGPGQVVAGQSDSTWTTYDGLGPTGTTMASDRIVAKVFKPGAGNPKLALTYASFADISITDRFGTTPYYFLYGMATPQAQMPLTGTANYAGIVYGRGTIGLANNEVTLDGTSTLSANFGSQTFTSTLNIIAKDNASSALTTLSPLTYSGAITGTSFREQTTGFPSLSGSFYGTRAAEFSAAFIYTGPVDPVAGQTKLFGVAIGKAVP